MQLLGALSLVDELVSTTFLTVLLTGFLLKSKKWKIISLIMLGYSIISIILAIILSPAPRHLGISDILIGLPFDLFLKGTPLLVIAGIPLSLIIGFKKKDLRIKLVSVGLLILGLIWFLILGYYLSKM